MKKFVTFSVLFSVMFILQTSYTFSAKEKESPNFFSKEISKENSKIRESVKLKFVNEIQALKTKKKQKELAARKASAKVKADSKKPIPKGQKASKVNPITSNQDIAISLSENIAEFEELKQINKRIIEETKKEIEANPTSDSKEVIAPVLFTLSDIPLPRDPENNYSWYIGNLVNAKPDFFVNDNPISKTVVAVVDAGVDFSNKDLAGVKWSNNVCFNEDGSEILSGCQGGYDFIDNDGNPYPIDGATHGNAVASLVGALTDNDFGIASLSKGNVEIMSLRVADGGVLDTENIVKAIYFAVNNGARVINMSFAGPTYSEKLSQAIDYADEHGVTVIAASGNQGKNLDVEKVYPASFEQKNVITVGAFDESGKIPSWVNRGKAVDVFAPGANIIANTGKDEFGFVNGTSFSAPIFASYLIAEIAKGKTSTTILNSLPTSNILKAISFDGKSVALPGNVSVEALKKYIGSEGEALPDGIGGFSLQGVVNPNLGSISAFYPDGSQSYPANYTNGNITFSWSSVYNANNGYCVVIRDTNTNAQVITGSNNICTYYTNKTFSLTTGSYYYTVVAYDINNNYIYSPNKYFKVGSNVITNIATPGNLFPGSIYSPGSVLNGTSQTLQWGAVSGASNYTVAFTNLNSNSTSYYTSNGTSLSVNVSAGYNYKWSVRANGSGLSSAYSSSNFFQVSLPNSAPSVPTLSGNSTVQIPSSYYLSTYSTDSNWDSIRYEVNWGTNSNTNSYGYYGSGYTPTIPNSYAVPGTYCIKARAVDGYGNASAFSPCKNITVTQTGGTSTGSTNTNTTTSNPSSGTYIKVLVTDKSGTAIPSKSVKVRAFTSALTQVGGEKSYTTDSAGSVLVNRTDFGSLATMVKIISDDGTAEKIENFTTNKVVNSTYKLQYTDITNYPVILVPGIMGSTINSLKGSIIPRLGSYTYPSSKTYDQSKLYLADAIGEWNINIVGNMISAKLEERDSLMQELGWDLMIKKLERNGYVNGKTIIACPYDWSADVPFIVNNYFKSCISKGLANTNKGKVDVIAHSMGGLVTRAYIQETGKTNGKSIRKIAFLGTPHLGATDSYAVWAGGYVEKSKFGARSLVLSSFYKDRGYPVPTISLQYQTLKIPVINSTFILPSDINSSFFTNSYLVANPSKLYDFLRKENALGLKSLVPIYSFLNKSGSGVYTQTNCYENTFLKALNGLPLVGSSGCPNPDTRISYSFKDFKSTLSNDGIDVKMIYGSSGGYNTLLYFPLSSAKGANLYQEGKPSVDLSNDTVMQTYKSPGDQTVPDKSTKEYFESIGLSSKNQNVPGTHHLLPKLAQTQTLQFITGKTTLQEVELSDIDTNILNLSVSPGVTLSLLQGGNVITPKINNKTNTGSYYSYTNLGNTSYNLQIQNNSTADYGISFEFISGSSANMATVYKQGGDTNPVNFGINSNASTDQPMLQLSIKDAPSLESLKALLESTPNESIESSSNTGNTTSETSNTNPVPNNVPTTQSTPTPTSKPEPRTPANKPVSPITKTVDKTVTKSFTNISSLKINYLANKTEATRFCKSKKYDKHTKYSTKDLKVTTNNCNNISDKGNCRPTSKTLKVINNITCSK